MRGAVRRSAGPLCIAPRRALAGGAAVGGHAGRPVPSPSATYRCIGRSGRCLAIARHMGPDVVVSTRWRGSRRASSAVGRHVPGLFPSSPEGVYTRHARDPAVSPRHLNQAGPPMLTRATILRLRTERAAPLRARFAIARIGLFGSYARDQATLGSDVDLLTEMTEPTFDPYMDAKAYLAEVLGASVDLVLAETLKPRLIPHVHRDLAYACRLRLVPGRLARRHRAYRRLHRGDGRRSLRRRPTDRGCRGAEPRDHRRGGALPRRQHPPRPAPLAVV
jgi:predicted nucleotidyltransferase